MFDVGFVVRRLKGLRPRRARRNLDLGRPAD